MQEQINNLQQQIDELKQALDNRDMSMELRETIRDEVIKDVTNTTYTQDITITSVPVVLTGLPAVANGIVIIKWRGKEYKIPFYN